MQKFSMAKKSMIAREVKRKKLVKNMLPRGNHYQMNLIQLKILWRDQRFIEKFRDFQETQHPQELGTDVGPQVSQGEYTEILDYAEIN